MRGSMMIRKPLSMLINESKETGEHSLRRTLGPEFSSCPGSARIMQGRD
jgi:hypothetical protein